MYETRSQALLPRAQFARRVVLHFAIAAGRVIIAGLVLSPIVHRLMHRFHWDEDDQ